MDFTNPLGIKYRTVNEVTHEGEPARVVSGSATVDADLEDLRDEPGENSALVSADQWRS